jgi:type I restriction enzyme S subunit
MIDQNELPKGWEVKKLGEVCQIVSGNTPKGLELASNIGDYQFYKVSDMNLLGNEVSMQVSKLKLTQKEIENLKIRVYPKGTVIFPKRGGAILTNKKRILSQDASFDLNLMGVLPNEKIDCEFLFFWFQKLDLSKIYDGSNVPQINNKNIAPIDFPLPPLPEQHRIVAKIEALFSQLDNGIAQLKTAQAQLKVYRQAVLKWAFEGRLTNKDVQEGELPEGWKWVKLGEVANSLDHLRRPINKEERLKRKGTIPYYGANGRTGWIDDYLFDEPLVLVVEDETFTARELPFSYKITGKSWVNNHAHILKPKGGLDIDFLNYQLSYYPFLPLTTGTTGRKKLTKNALMNAAFRTCPISEQHLIVQEIESRLSVCDKLEETITQALQQSEALRQSILKRAFEGRLVAQETGQTVMLKNKTKKDK